MNAINNCAGMGCQSHQQYEYYSSSYCNAQTEKFKCLSFSKQLLACRLQEDPSSLFTEHCPAGKVDDNRRMDTYDKHSEETLIRIWHIQCTIIMTLIAIAMARVAGKLLPNGQRECKSWLQVFAVEFVMISLPAVVSVNIANKYVEYILAVAIAVLAFVSWRSKCLPRAAQREFEFGRRPSLFTLLRSTISLLTVLCILAIDFASFPRKFRKSRRYGAGLMDVGIGLFVFSMALVSPRAKRLADLRKQFFPVGCMLALGLARTIVITSIDYHQDEHEYGKHLNAFFTLGLTKMFATIFGLLARNDKYLFPMGIVILVVHEITLQCGLSEYVLDPDLQRTDLLSANREGLCSLPGFIALFILSQYFGQWIKSKDILNYEEIKQKLKHLIIISIALWLIVISSTLAIGMARVTCNFAYVTWMLAISVTMCSLYLFVFDIVLDTLLPVASKENRIAMVANQIEASTEGTPLTKSVNALGETKIPTFIESINYNGLLYFLLGNVLTGMVNIFLGTDDRSDTESVLILMAYMLVTGGVVSLLYRYKIRIA
uniref:Phosphatidylinositol-glycan biosynthesis class W protein n=1 Tax=Stomoxys calcitrans TaxID=35570 RepID=A0A1I8Q806_STOCA